jgi:chromosome segregation ATPase
MSEMTPEEFVEAMSKMPTTKWDFERKDWVRNPDVEKLNLHDAALRSDRDRWKARAEELERTLYEIEVGMGSRTKQIAELEVEVARLKDRLKVFDDYAAAMAQQYTTGGGK